MSSSQQCCAVKADTHTQKKHENKCALAQLVLIVGNSDSCVLCDVLHYLEDRKTNSNKSLINRATNVLFAFKICKTGNHLQRWLIQTAPLQWNSLLLLNFVYEFTILLFSPRVPYHSILWRYYFWIPFNLDTNSKHKGEWSGSCSSDFPEMESSVCEVNLKRLQCVFTDKKKHNGW